MLLFLKGFLIGVGKIIPGVSGAMLAMNFGIYEKLVNSITNFFDDWKENFKFIIIVGLGIILSIIIFSDVILFLINKYKFLTMIFFIGLICGSTYYFFRKSRLNFKYYILSFLIVLLFFIISNITINIRTNYSNNIIFFIGGFIEVLASIIPGISATSLLMIMGIYEDVLFLISNSLELGYIISNFNIYFSYLLGMFISLIINLLLINYLLKKYRNISYAIILGLSIGSIFYLCMTIFSIKVTFFEIILGIILFLMGVKVADVFN